MKAVQKRITDILSEHIQSEVIIKHSRAVAAAMKGYAGKYANGKQEIEYWEAVGLLHDIDFEKYPDEHPHRAKEFLAPEGFSEKFIEDVLSHCWDENIARTDLQKVLFAVDEMTGFVIACALVRPDKSLENLEVRSVLKKIKDKAFAKAVDRDGLKKGALMLGIPLEEHIECVRKSLIAAGF